MKKTILGVLLLLMPIAARAAKPASDTEQYPGMAAVMEHIRTAFPQTIKSQKEDRGDIIGVPYPFTSPCAKEGFKELFYWDTHFMNLGLLRIDLGEQAKHNTDDLLFLVDKLGFVPNANRRSMTNRSQPAFLALMVRDVYANTGDHQWLKDAFATLKKEYDFWMARRMSPAGLNHHHNSATKQQLQGFYNYLAKERFKGIKLVTKEAEIAFSSNALSEAESGWDFTPRFDRRAEEFCPIDLNSNLYVYETTFAEFSKLLGLDEENVWRERAEQRKRLIQELLWNDELGCYTEYDWKNKKKGDLVSCATLFPLMAGIASPEQADKVVRKMRAVLEYDHGLSTCEKRPEKFVYQWDYPNGWPPMQCIAIQALDRYGYKDDARRIAEKYVRTVIRGYQKTKDLWEKYNVATGTLDVADEYQMPRMVGWTAGTFVLAADYLKRGAAAPRPVVRTSDPATATHKFKIGPITIGCSDRGGGYLNYVDLGDGRNIVSVGYGRGWQGSVRDQFHSGRYNPTQAGFTDTAGAPVHLIASEHGIAIPKFNLALYGDPVFDFTAHEDLAPDFRGYKDHGNSDTTGLDKSSWTQDDELRSEFDFEGSYEDAAELVGGTIPVLRFYSRYTYARPPKAIRQFGKRAIQADGKPVINESARAKDISRVLPGNQPATDDDLSQVVFTAYGIRLLTEFGYTLPMWFDRGKWQSLSIETIKGRGKEREFELGPSSAGKKKQASALDARFLVLAKGDDPDASPAIGLYTPSRSEINTHQVLGLDKNSGKTVYREDRRIKGIILFSHVIPSQVDIRSRFFLTGMLAPGHGKPNVLEALQNETFVLFGTPNQIRKCVETLKKKLP